MAYSDFTIWLWYQYETFCTTVLSHPHVVAGWYPAVAAIVSPWMAFAMYVPHVWCCLICFTDCFNLKWKCAIKTTLSCKHTHVVLSLTLSSYQHLDLYLEGKYFIIVINDHWICIITSITINVCTAPCLWFCILYLVLHPFPSVHFLLICSLVVCGSIMFQWLCGYVMCLYLVYLKLPDQFQELQKFAQFMFYD